ncbi:MAG: NADH-quinone oxidoreductase subunit L [Cytophagales bacterium]|nr:MAG: NADH-quinone oxidoreductase subunit L [Cytophagales bacterium]
MASLVYSIWWLPFVAFLVLILSNTKVLQKQGDVLAAICVGIALVLSILLFSFFFGYPSALSLFLVWDIQPTWQIIAYLKIDSLSSLMLLLVTLIALLVILFSRVYMQHEKNYNRYFAYLSFFVFTMLGLLLMDNLLMLYVFWELVGLSSFLLIGFWYEKKQATQAAFKAFITNRIADAAFLVGIFGMYYYFNTFSLTAISTQLSLHTPQATNYTLVGLLLFMGCVGKSAQFPLYIWLPDAMEGPTPISALIHAATMVAAGIYLVARLYFIFTIEAFLVISIIGSITALIGAFSALCQYDLKKTLAYSTISQLGLMVAALGVYAYESALMHLVTHAFFKAGLFLSAGAILHYLHGIAHKYHLSEDQLQDMRQMGGLMRLMPITFVFYTIFALALVGFPFTSGFLSKDDILVHTWAWAWVEVERTNQMAYLFIPIALMITSFLTAMYVARQWFLLFFGDFKMIRQNTDWQNIQLVTEKRMLFFHIPLAVLTVGALWISFSYNPLETYSGWFMRNIEAPENTFVPVVIEDLIFEQSLNLHYTIVASSIGIILLAFGLNALYFMRIRSKRIETYLEKTWLYRLSLHSFYLDYYYQWVIFAFFHRSGTFLEVKSWRKRLSIHWFEIWSWWLRKIKGEQPKLSPKAALSYVAHLSQDTDERLINRLVHQFSRGYVVLAHIVHWFDHFWVDGFIRGFARWVIYVGKQLRNPSKGQIQQYLGLTLMIVLLIWLLTYLFL